jgi:tRNA (adenine57-N1/adenine58-N1)-methyltransferase
MKFGSTYYTPKGKLVHLLKPTIYDFVMKSERKTQIIYPKDLGYIAARSGLQSGFKILEVGTGSAALTTYFAALVKPDGHIFTYDINEEFMQIARKNLERAGLDKYVTMKKHTGDGYIEKDIDVAIIDLGDPWTVIPFVYASLKSSGSVAAICPTMNQLEKTSYVMENEGFTDIECSEIISRNIEARLGKTRPSMRMIGHTTYLIFARKISKPESEV